MVETSAPRVLVLGMPVPTSTSAEALDRYAAGKRTTVTRGPAWKDVRLTIMSLPPVSDIFTMPAVTGDYLQRTDIVVVSDIYNI
jgi:hypothetical protein